jgi:hypothetical protein
VTVVRLTHEVIPRHESADEDIFEGASGVKMSRETVNIIAQGVGKDFDGTPFVVTGTRDAHRRHEIAR